MSYSQLFILNKNLEVAQKPEWQNSWLFPIPVFKYLINKYASEEEKQKALQEAKKYQLEGSIDEEYPINPITFFMFDTNNAKFREINNKINNSEILVDRIGWELVNQQMFRSSDKNLVAAAICELQEKIKADEERFSEIAAEIRNIDENENPFFIFKNNTIDDSVEKYFDYYNEETDDWEQRSLKDYKGELFLSLVILEDGKMLFAEPFQGVEA